MERKLQNIIFPHNFDTEEVHNLYYRRYKPVLDRDKQILYLMDNSILDFCTYLNSCSYAKWKKYTGVKSLCLNIDGEGSFDVIAVGYHIELNIVKKSELARVSVDMEKRQSISIEIPDNDEVIVGFDFVAKKNAVFYGGEYVGVFEDGKKINPVELSLATTTCKKEKYILGNLEILKKEIFNSDDEMKNHFYVHVIDNGRTLDAAALSGGKITVHPNKNVGGSGGFARGMIESLRQTPQATHVLLMDDDVLVLPESIKRTYRLLQLMNDEYKNCNIEGAMLLMEQMTIQHEDVGVFEKKGYVHPRKPRFLQDNLWDNIKNEIFFANKQKLYGAWWFCCIPVETVKKNGLPLPIFVRTDDIEYGLRSGSDIITMNGICIWHMGFFSKYNVSMNVYQSNRNFLIAQAVGTIDKKVPLLRPLRNAFFDGIVSLYYDESEIACRALEDYLKGPKFLEEGTGEEVFMANNSLNEKLVSMDDECFEDIEWKLDSIWANPPRSFLKKIWFRLTMNGHRFWPSFLRKKKPVEIAFNGFYQPAKFQNKSVLISTNPDAHSAAIRKFDKKRGRALIRRWKKVLRRYKRENKRVQKEYREAFPYLTSEEFWKKYLGI